MAFSFYNQEIKFNLKNKHKVKCWLENTIIKEKKIPGNINYLFTSDAYMLQQNQRYLNHNTFTDIITFDSNHENTINGDILISIERVKENAEKFTVSFDDELKRVMVHGVLHLCGYKDKKSSEAKRMRLKENQALLDYKKNFSK
jgi:probable rRNA maturation factor